MRRSAPERALAWLVTGPVGHLAAGIADWVTLLGRLAAGAARRRRAGAPDRPPVG
jgi:hypothetical protein